MPQDTPDIGGTHLLCLRTHLTLGDTSTVPQDTPDIAELVETYSVVKPVNDCLAVPAVGQVADNMPCMKAEATSCVMCMAVCKFVSKGLSVIRFLG